MSMAYEWLRSIPHTAAHRHCHTIEGRAKVTHRTREAAEAEAAYFTRMKDVPVVAYWCDIHQGWHCGSVKP